MLAATCCKKLLQIQKHLVAPPEKVNVTSARVVVMAKKGVVTNKFEDLDLSEKQHIRFAMKDMVEALAVKVMHEQNANVAKA